MNTIKKYNKQEIRKRLAMFFGDPPYDDPGNPCRGDGYFVRSLEDAYGMSLEDLKKYSGYLKR